MSEFVTRELRAAAERAGIKVTSSSTGTATVKLEGANDPRDGWHPLSAGDTYVRARYGGLEFGHAPDFVIDGVTRELVEGERAKREVVALRRLLWLVLMAGAAPGEAVRRIDIPDSALADWDEERAELTEWPDVERLGITVQARLLHSRTCRCNGTGSVRVAVQTPGATPTDLPDVVWHTVPCPN